MGLFNTISAVDDDSCPFPAVSFVRRRLARDVDIFILKIVKKSAVLASVRERFFALLSDNRCRNCPSIDVLANRLPVDVSS